LRINLRLFSPVIALIAVALSHGAQAFPLAGPGSGFGNLPKYIEAGRSILAPMGHVVLCARKPHLCEPRGGATIVRATPRLDSLLAYVNADINHTIVQVNDEMDNGFADTWRVAVTKGDCEDMALAKRERLIKAGVSPRALRIAVALTPWGEGHAVLVVRTSKGDVVLDNRDDVIRPWGSTDLTWIKIQSADNPRRWHAI
jgi:predicted transglutaminase-like cysteine proteinase